VPWVAARLGRARAAQLPPIWFRDLLLGHASIQSTLVYAHALGDDLKVALAQVPGNSPKRLKRSQITALSEPDHTILGRLRLLVPPCPHWSQSPISEGFESG
jgi:hypothetical protein